MRLLELLRRDRRRRPPRIRAPNGWIASVEKRKGSPCQGDDADGGDPRAGKTARYAFPEDLPEDIWRHIHCLMPLRDAARAACVSHAFLDSWRCRPNLILNCDKLCREVNLHGKKLHAVIDQILRTRSSGCLKKLKLTSDSRVSPRRLDSWFRAAVAPGIEELTLVQCRESEYMFPCSLLSEGGVRNSIRRLELHSCAFRPPRELGLLRSLTSLHLFQVYIPGNELECLLSKAPALERLEIDLCEEILVLKIPYLQKLSYLMIAAPERLPLVEIKAPNISTFELDGEILKLSLGETLQMKDLVLFRANAIHYARAELASIMPNLETLDLAAAAEEVNTPMLPSKFLYLKHLAISIVSGGNYSPTYDYFSLVSFLDASPSLETLVLNVSRHLMKRKSVLGDSSHLRQLPELHHCRLRRVKVIGFTSEKSLVELACYVLKNAVSLEDLTLDTLYDSRCSGEGAATHSNGVLRRSCLPMSNRVIREARRALMAVKEYIEDKVPPAVKLTVLGPCERCHAKAGTSL